MVRFYRTRDGEVVSLRDGHHYNGRNFFRFNPVYLGSQDFLAEEIKQPPDDLARAHLAKWELVSQAQDPINSRSEKSPYGAS